MEELTATTLVDELAFPEGPRWHKGALWVSDQHDHHVLRIAEDGAIKVVGEVPGCPSGLGWLADGRMLVVSMHDRRVLRMTDDGELERFADLSSLAGFHCNDMVVDVHGNAFVGNFGFDLDGGEAPGPAVLARVNAKGEVSVAADDLLFPNGCVISADHATLVVGETLASRLTAFDLAPDGVLSNRRGWAELEGVAPDGCCLDAEGAIWVADPMGQQVLRVREGGEITARVAIGGDNTAFACMLGSSDRRTLFVCTAPTSNPEEAVQRRGGRIEATRVDVPGAGLP